jgi:hypothetical protein
MGSIERALPLKDQEAQIHTSLSLCRIWEIGRPQTRFVLLTPCEVGSRRSHSGDFQSSYRVKERAETRVLEPVCGHRTLEMEATLRLVAVHADSPGMFAPSEIFGSRDFLKSIFPEHLSIDKS